MLTSSSPERRCIDSSSLALLDFPPPVFGCSTRDIHNAGTERNFSRLAAYLPIWNGNWRAAIFLSQLPSFLSEWVAAIENESSTGQHICRLPQNRDRAAATTSALPMRTLCTAKLRRPDSNPNVVCGRSFAAFVARIENTARLDEQQFDLFGCIGLVFNSFRYDKHLSG